MVAFAYSNFLCVSVKLYLLLTNLLIGIALYFVSEILHRKQEQQAKEWEKEKKEFGMVSAEEKGDNA